MTNDSATRNSPMPADERATREIAEGIAFDWAGPNHQIGCADAIFAALKEADRLAREDAARIAEQFGDKILMMWDRPGGPPGNGYVPLTGKHVAAAIRASITTDEE